MKYLFCFVGFIWALLGCTTSHEDPFQIQTISGLENMEGRPVWLSHEHILVDFIGADRIDPEDWEVDTVLSTMLPYLKAVEASGVDYFVEITPNFLGRDMRLLEKIAQKVHFKILTNTGLYGAVNNKYLPAFAYTESAAELAARWIKEFEEGIEGTSIKPGLIKISVDNLPQLDSLDEKLVHAAALTHKQTGLTIASHTGAAQALWPQLAILKEQGVGTNAFIWVHAQNEEDPAQYLKAAEAGCWISLDGIGWSWEQHLEKILFAKANNILDHILISHDAGWYDPQKAEQSVQPYTNMFDKLYPALLERGFTEEEWEQIVSLNPSRAYGIKIR